ncbi:glycosyltransferase [uncultured Winogradskyella sp.]|uniref:glycosyltransferase n=1 Tax=uncultured Winogradskyella sp. TaxID=395353 RepID=UPI0035196380
MIITWLIPDTYGFLLDELEELSSKTLKLRVLSGKPIPKKVRERLPEVAFYYCPPKSIVLQSLRNKRLRLLWQWHGWRLLKNTYHANPIAGLYAVLNQLEKKAPSDVIHSHFAYPGGVGARLLDKPQLLTLRGYDVLTTGHYGATWNFFFRKNLIASFRKNTIVTGGSGYTVERARQILGWEADIRYVKEGITFKSFDRAHRFDRNALDIKQNEMVLLSVGNLVDVKSHALLFSAYAALEDRIKQTTRIIICGDGPLRADLEKQCKSLGIDERVVFLGQLPRQELADIFELSDVLVHPSMSEGFGNVILEAMFFKLLVIASPVGVARDIIMDTKNGYLPKLGDKQSWKTCLEHVLQKDLKSFRKVLDKNHQMVLNTFSMEQRIDAFLELYRETVKNSAE